MMMSPTQNEFNHVVAFEVSKDNLVVHTLPGDRQVCLSNTPKAIRRRLQAELKRNRKERLGALLVVCEATGRYERRVLAACVELGVKVHRAHGARVRLFAKYLGLAKTDPIDARMLARYGARSEGLRLYEPPSPEEAALKELKARRDQIQAMPIAENNRLEHAAHPSVLKSLKAQIAGLRKAFAALEVEIATLVRSHEAFARKARLMRSVKGVGPVTVATVLADMPEFGRLSKGEAARLAGRAPVADGLSASILGDW